MVSDNHGNAINGVHIPTPWYNDTSEVRCAYVTKRIYLMITLISGHLPIWNYILIKLKGSILVKVDWIFCRFVILCCFPHSDPGADCAVTGYAKKKKLIELEPWWLMRAFSSRQATGSSRKPYMLKQKSNRSAFCEGTIWCRGANDGKH